MAPTSQHLAMSRLGECQLKHEPAYIGFAPTATNGFVKAKEDATSAAYPMYIHGADDNTFWRRSAPAGDAGSSAALLAQVFNDLQARNQAFGRSCSHSWDNSNCSEPADYNWQQKLFSGEQDWDTHQHAQVPDWEASQRSQAMWNWRTGKIEPPGTKIEPPRRFVFGAPVAAPLPTNDDEEERTDRRRKPRRRHSHWQSQLILATSLRALADKNPDCVIYARKVQKLGLKSAELLRRHYEQYGPVEEILLSNAHNKPANCPAPVRVRASGIALIVMRNPDDVTKILAEGDTQVVNGVPISVRRFEERPGLDNQQGEFVESRGKDDSVMSDGGSTRCGSNRFGSDYLECFDRGDDLYQRGVS